MFDKLKDLNKLRKIQKEVKSQLDNMNVAFEQSGIKVILKGDKKIEKIEIDGEENVLFKEILNKAMKEVDKKVEKQMRGQLQDLGLPGL